MQYVCLNDSYIYIFIIKFHHPEINIVRWYYSRRVLGGWVSNCICGLSVTESSAWGWESEWLEEHTCLGQNYNSQEGFQKNKMMCMILGIRFDVGNYKIKDTDSHNCILTEAFMWINQRRRVGSTEMRELEHDWKGRKRRKQVLWPEAKGAKIFNCI